jgi:Xaa-Pro aminopeptidase
MQESTLSHLTPADERERRLRVVREAMSEAGLDALVIFSRGDEFLRGRVQYVSDIFQWAGWGIVVLPISGETSFVGDPLWGLARAEAAGWVTDIRATFEPATEVASILSDHALSGGSIGLVGTADAAAAQHIRDLETALANASITDATDLFDDVRAVKSDYEIAKLYETSAILRSVFRALAAEIRPGVQERDVLAEAHRLCRQYGCLDGIAQIARPPFKFFGWGSDVPIQPDDLICIDLEWGGPSGYWLELRRCFSFGEPPDRARKFFELRQEVFSACVDTARAGTASTEIAAARDRVYERHGYELPTEPRFTSHGIGIDSLEPPWVPGKDRVLQERMVLSLHPDIVVTDPDDLAHLSGLTISDNILVTANGGRRMTDLPAVDWVVLDA